VRRDALGTDDALGDPLLSRPEAVRRKAELADAFRALDWFADHLLLFEDRGPEARGGEWPCGHPSGRSSADDDRVVHSTMERGSELFRPYAVASAGNRTAVCSISSRCFATAAGAMPIWAASSGIFESRLRYTLFSTTIERTSRWRSVRRRDQSVECIRGAQRQDPS